jgi:CRP-like cAMP-binding protein
VANVILVGEQAVVERLRGVLVAAGHAVTTLPKVGLSVEDAPAAGSPEVLMIANRSGDERDFIDPPARRGGEAGSHRARQHGLGLQTLLPSIEPTIVTDRKYDRGSVLEMPLEFVGEILDGVVAQWAVHEDGAQSLTGLLTPGDFLLSHPLDDCHLYAIAHTEVRIAMLPWGEVAGAGKFVDNLRSRLVRSEAWAAMQARPYVEARIIGILHLLAEQFGVEHEGGCLIDLRLTHAQLAGAVGSTRVTVTRILNALTKRGDIRLIETEAGQRFYIRSG